MWSDFLAKMIKYLGVYSVYHNRNLLMPRHSRTIYLQICTFINWNIYHAIYLCKSTRVVVEIFYTGQTNSINMQTNCLIYKAFPNIINGHFALFDWFSNSQYIPFMACEYFCSVTVHYQHQCTACQKPGFYRKVLDCPTTFGDCCIPFLLFLVFQDNDLFLKQFFFSSCPQLKLSTIPNAAILKNCILNQNNYIKS